VEEGRTALALTLGVISSVVLSRKVSSVGQISRVGTGDHVDVLDALLDLIRPDLDDTGRALLVRVSGGRAGLLVLASRDRAHATGLLEVGVSRDGGGRVDVRVRRERDGSGARSRRLLCGVGDIVSDGSGQTPSTNERLLFDALVPLKTLGRRSRLGVRRARGGSVNVRGVGQGDRA
jgi:hypothetical protein